MCNISAFIMVENHKGYYLHGKSPYESSDCTMEELVKNLTREGSGATTTRGLTASGCQVFTFFEALHNTEEWRNQWNSKKQADITGTEWRDNHAKLKKLVEDRNWDIEL
jgi:hypothetical protein